VAGFRAMKPLFGSFHVDFARCPEKRPRGAIAKAEP